VHLKINAKNKNINRDQTRKKIEITISSSAWLSKKSNYFATLISDNYTYYAEQEYTTKIKIKIVMVNQAFIKK